jgi:hypothetical protein
MFGCGNYDCVDCYPFQYRCSFCDEEFPEPLANGKNYVCEVCEWEHNKKEDDNAQM